MAVKLSTSVRNARLDSIESTIGTDPVLQIFNGSLPASCAAADVGTKIAEGTLPTDYLSAASGGAKSKAGSWTITGVTAAGSGTDGTYFRIKDSSATTCHLQGTFGDSGTEDMVADNANIADTQVATVQTFTLTDGNA